MKNKIILLSIMFLLLLRIASAIPYSLTGDIYEDGTVIVYPLEKLDTDIDDTVEDLLSPYIIKIYSSSGLVKQHKPPLEGPFSADGVNNFLAFEIALNLPDDITKISIWSGRDMLAQFGLQGVAPEIHSFIVNEQADHLDLSWETSDQDGDNVYVSLYYLFDGESVLFAPYVESTSYTIAKENMPGSDFCQFKIVAQDLMHSTEKISDPFTIADKDPYVYILYPEDSLYFFNNNILSLSGFAYDPEDGVLEPSWYINNELVGNGEQLFIATPEAGDYILTLRAEDSNGNIGEAQMQISIKNGPVYIDSCQTLNRANTVYYLSQDIGDNSFICIRITSPSITLDCQGHSITSDSSYIGVYSAQDYTTIKNCDIDVGSWGTGIRLSYSSNNHIFNNVLNGQYTGLSSYLVSDSIIEDNTINSNKIGILLTGISPRRSISISSNNKVSNNFACRNSLYDFKCDQYTEGTYGNENKFTKVNPCSNNWPVLGIDYDYCSPSPESPLPSPSPIPSPTEYPTASPYPSPSP